MRVRATRERPGNVEVRRFQGAAFVLAEAAPDDGVLTSLQRPGEALGPDGTCGHKHTAVGGRPRPTLPWMQAAAATSPAQQEFL
jgi:hypothetical protein